MVLQQLTGPMCYVGGWQSQTCFQRSRLEPVFSTRPETASTRYRAVAFGEWHSSAWVLLVSHDRPFLAAEEQLEVPAGEPSGL